MLIACNGANTDFFRCLVTLEVDDNQCISSQDNFRCPRRTVTLKITAPQPNNLTHEDRELCRCLREARNLCDVVRRYFPMQAVKCV